MKKIKMVLKVIARAIKNAIAWVFFWYLPTCPNCGDSSWWKPFASPVFRMIGNQSDQFQACRECLSDSSRLDIKRIRKDLSRLGWPEEAIAQAIVCMFTGQATVVAKIVDGAIVPVEKIAEPAIPAAETITLKEPVPA